MIIYKQNNTHAPSGQVISWGSGLVLIGLSIWCLRSALQCGLPSILPDRISIGSPVMTLISLTGGVAFFLFLCLGGVFSAYLGSTRNASSTWSLLQPNSLKLAVLASLIAFSVLVLSERTATSKITWRETRGAPLAFLTVTEYRGPDVDLGYRIFRVFENLNALALAVDISVVYYAICTSAEALRRLTRTCL